MPFVLPLHLVMMSKYSKFGVDTLSTFIVIGYIKVLAQKQRRQWQSSDHNSSTFSSKQTNRNSFYSVGELARTKI